MKYIFYKQKRKIILIILISFILCLKLTIDIAVECEIYNLINIS